ncbi:putative RNA-directed DNA polymerase [Tanacetum coccineum]
MMRLKYTDGSPISDHLNSFQGIINQLADGVITMELAKGSILNEETRRKSQGSSSQSDVLVTKRRGRSQSRGPSNRGNHRSSSSKGKFADVECYHCHKKGHTMKFCRQLKKENKKKNYNNQKNKHKKDNDGDDNTEVNTTTEYSFVCDFGVVKMCNTRLSRIAGIGDICLKFDTRMELVLHNVKHVPGMRLNIISTGLLDKDGYHNSSGNGLWKVTLGSLIMARGKRESKLYMTHPKISKSIVNAVDNDDMTELWHKRLGHMSEKGMSILSKKNVLSGVHDINLKKCSHCLAGKQTRLAFKSRSPFRMENILDLVHSDVCGPMKTKTLGGCSYFVTFIDDHSRKHQKTPPKTPQLNGLAERMNRTLVERGMEVGKDVSYRHLRVFGCKAFVHIPKDERSKLDVKTKPCVFLGYGQDEFRYRLYDPVQKRLVRSRDVVFEEDQTLKDVENAEEGTILIIMMILLTVDPLPPNVRILAYKNLDEDVILELAVPDMPHTSPLSGLLDTSSFHTLFPAQKLRGKGGYCVGLQKSLYGLKQAPRQWYKKFESVIGKQGYRKTSSDHADEEISDGGSPRVIVYGYDGLPIQPVAPPSPDYVPGPEHPPSPDYVPGPEHPPSPVEIPYIPKPEYPKYLVPSEDEAPMEGPTSTR